MKDLFKKMRTMMILRGLPASGKSTYAKQLLQKEPGRWKRVNKDDLRNMIDAGQWSHDNEKFIRNLQDNIIRNALSTGFDILVDNTHLVGRTLNKLHQLAESIGDIKFIERPFQVSLEECLKRNSEREENVRVPDKVIMDMAKSAGLDKKYNTLSDKETYYPPKSEINNILVQNESLPKAIICDLDGTLALIGDRSPYDASNCHEKDFPHWPVIECVLAMYDRGYEIIFMTGREEKHREVSEKFIAKYCLDRDFKAEENIVPHQLFMRGNTDSRKDAVVKEELFNTHVSGKYNVKFVLDDRPQVIRQWRSMGLTVFALNDREF